MPELPEVETISQALKANILNKTISKIKILTEFSLREKIPKVIENITNVKVIDVKRQAKYIQIFLSDSNVILVHLGMSGTITFNQDINKKHNHLLIEFTDDNNLTYNDPRRFGLITLVKNDELHRSKYIKNLGVEPLGIEFTPEYLAKSFMNKSQAIKQTLMDNSIIVGVGNIYASESLFLSNISPTRPAKSLNIIEINKLYNAVIEILKDAIAKGGSSLKDYTSINGDSGYFQNHFKVYAREGKECLVCNSPEPISRITQGNRASFYCSNCQK